MKIIVGTNTLTQVPQPSYSNHCQLWYRLAKKHPDIEFFLCNPLRTSIDNMRNMVAQVALKNDIDYILFIDDDVLVPFDVLDKLIACDADIAAGWTLIRGYPFKNMFFKYSEENPNDLLHYEKPVIGEDGIIDVDAVGFSCCLIKVDLLRKVSQPYFITGGYNTEDIYFCVKAKREQPDTKIVVDAKVITQHMLNPEFISPLNKEAYKTYYETINPECKNYKDPVISPDDVKKVEVEGGVSYEDMIKERFKT